MQTSACQKPANFDIFAHFADQANQRQTIERTYGVICNNHHAPLCRNIIALALGNAVAEIKVIKNAINKIDTAIALVLAQKSVDLALVRELAQNAEGGIAHYGRLLGKAGEFIGNGLFDIQHGSHNLSRTDALRL